MYDQMEKDLESGRAAAIALTVLAGVVIIALAVVKVKNELQMTKAYERQAVALEKMAGIAPPAPEEPFLEPVAPTAPVGRIKVAPKVPACPHQLDGPLVCGDWPKVEPRNLPSPFGCSTCTLIPWTTHFTEVISR